MRKCIDVEIGTTGRSEALFTADAGWSGHGCYSPETEREVCLLTHIITPALFPLLFPNPDTQYGVRFFTKIFFFETIFQCKRTKTYFPNKNILFNMMVFETNFCLQSQFYFLSIHCINNCSLKYYLKNA